MKEVGRFGVKDQSNIQLCVIMLHRKVKVVDKWHNIETGFEKNVIK